MPAPGPDHRSQSGEECNAGVQDSHLLGQDLPGVCGQQGQGGAGEARDRGWGSRKGEQTWKWAKQNSQFKVGFNEEGVYDASDYRTIYTLVGNTKQRGVGDLFKRGLMAAFMLRILELTPFFFNGGSDPRNVKLQVSAKISNPLKISNVDDDAKVNICKHGIVSLRSAPLSNH